MKTLELKHLAPYEYLGLKIQCIDKNDQRYNSIFTLTQLHKHHKFVAVAGYNSFYPYEFKPILRPLSDLTKEIKIDGKKLTPCKMFSGRDNMLLDSTQRINNAYDSLYKLTYVTIERLFEWHFDVFGLIPEGLAIDINTLEK